jgi:hypothetical protein
MIEVGYTSTYRLHKYFLLFAETSRLWHKVTVYVTIIASSQNSALSWITSPDVTEQEQTTFKSVTRISLIVVENASGKFSIDDAHSGIIDDLEEARMSNEETILQNIEEIGCQTFVQNSVVVRSRVRAFSHLVQVQSGSYIEEKMPFARAGLPDDNQLYGDPPKDFFNDIKQLRSLHECSAVIQFAGVVLDNTRKHLSFTYASGPL